MNTFILLKILANLMLPPASLAVGVVLWLPLHLVGLRRLAVMTLGPATTEAEAMRRFLLDRGVPEDVIVSEGRALNTIENIRNVRDLVNDGMLAIVTSAFHVPRAARLARRGGLNFSIFGVDWSVPSDAVVWWDRWLLSVGALGESNVAIRELVALCFRPPRG